MEQSIRFLHTADLHIGAPMRGFRALNDYWAERLRHAIVDAYDRVIETAVANKVDFVVVAGDVFDTSRPSYGDYLHFFEGLDRLGAAGIPTYLITGNHDPFTTWRRDCARLPSSAHLLGGEATEFAVFERDGAPLCLIGARGYRNQAWPVDEPVAGGISRSAAIDALKGSYPRAAEAPFTIGIIHTGLNLDQSKAYSDPATLVSADVDYWACGHLHKRYVLPSEDRPRIVFPGCIQARDLKESGERGCFLVGMTRQTGAEAADVSIEFVPTASVVFRAVRADVSACQTLADISRLIMAQLFHENANVNCDEMVVRVILEGETDLHAFLTRPEVIADLRKRLNNAYPTFYCDTLVDRTRPPRDDAAIRSEGLFAGHVLRVAEQQRTHEAEMVNYIQAEFVKRGIDLPSSLARRIGEFNDIAETLVLDLLEEEER